MYFSRQTLLSSSWYSRCNEAQQDWQSFKISSSSMDLKYKHFILAVPFEALSFQNRGKRTHTYDQSLLLRPTESDDISWAERDHFTGRTSLPELLEKIHLLFNIAVCHGIASSRKPIVESESFYKIFEGKMHKGEWRNKAYYYKDRALRMKITLKIYLTMTSTSESQKCFVE